MSKAAYVLSVRFEGQKRVLYNNIKEQINIDHFKSMIFLLIYLIFGLRLNQW